MTVETAELLERIAGTLRHEIGPAVGDEYTRTQAFMASVILGKLSKEQALAPGHRAAEQADMEELHRSLVEPLRTAPEDVGLAARASAATGTVAGLGSLIEAIYAWGTEDADAAKALASIRVTLRRDINRRMEIAK